MMMVADSLVVIGMAIASLGTIHEADGVQERSFWLRNAGSSPVVLHQGYTSCGCTTIRFAQGDTLQSGDSTRVDLLFNPRGKGGEFHESATVVYGDRRQRVTMAMTGTCVTSEETLLRQFPIRIDDQLRLSADRFDLGRMHTGERKERSVVVLHRDEHDRQELFTIRYTANGKLKGLQHIAYPIETRSQGRKRTLTVTLDVFLM